METAWEENAIRFRQYPDRDQHSSSDLDAVFNHYRPFLWHGMEPALQSALQNLRFLGEGDYDNSRRVLVSVLDDYIRQPNNVKDFRTWLLKQPASGWSFDEEQNEFYQNNK